MQLRVGCRAGQLGSMTHDLFVLVLPIAPDVLAGAPTASTLPARPESSAGLPGITPTAD